MNANTNTNTDTKKAIGFAVDEVTAHIFSFERDYIHNPKKGDKGWVEDENGKRILCCCDGKFWLPAPELSMMNTGK